VSTKIAIIGGGIAGLTAAIRLVDAGFAVTVIEAADRVGGALETREQEGFLFETGPNTVLDSSPRVAELIDRVGLGSVRIGPTAAAKNRFIVRDGKPVPIPMSPIRFLRSPILSGRAKLRIAGELFVPRRDAGAEESVADFVTRRVGREFLTYLLDPLVAGVYAGRPERLSLRHAFPRMYALEADHGGLIKGAVKILWKRRREGTKKRKSEMVSFPTGLGALPAACRQVEGPSFLLQSRTVDLARREGGWEVTCVRGGSRETLRADHVLWAGPAHVLPSVTLDGAASSDFALLGEIVHPPVTVVQLGYRRDDVEHPLDGFGALVPAVEKRQVLGILFPSSIFPGRAPEGHVLLTAYVGGGRNPEGALRPRPEILERVKSDARDLLGARGRPVFEEVIVHEKAIPQYEIGYGRFLDKIAEMESAYPGLYFTGNYRGGISVADTIRNAYRVAERMIEEIGSRTAAAARND
jgi:oxygen-dependent protoporphyrinogen oxidase